jgi:SagB-type dehydrogenase family enzyme
VDVVMAYHRQTTHRPGRYARSLGYMDWETQPDPFRVYEGAPRLPLPLAPAGLTPGFEAAAIEGLIPPRPLDAASAGQLFQDSLGLSAWKQAGEARWALRMNPSSGNLHPTEGYLVAGPIPGLSETAAVYHYHPRSHALERRAALPAAAWAALSAGLPPGSALVGLTSVYTRESWKYGERAFRYCQHDAGHAIAAIAIAAAGLGWRARLLEGLGDPALAALLGVAGQSGMEAEHPDALIALTPADAPGATGAAAAAALAAGALDAVTWDGSPSTLGEGHQPWPIIESVHDACWREAGAVEDLWGGPRPESALPIGDAPIGLRPIIHQRRSAVEMDAKTGISRDAFFQILLKCLPGRGQVPFAALPWRPRVHLMLFVHRVADVTPGLYALVRDAGSLDELKEAMDPDFAWEAPAGCPAGLPLYRLKETDSRGVAAGVSCGQAIAGDGVFAAAMIAEFEAPLAGLGPWMYKRLHWEAGAIGQVLYLEAEASGIRATGIGCFFDDETHRLFGLRGPAWRDLYHFTVGGPIDDDRLQTLPPYADREG